MSYLIETGRWSGRIRKHLREFLDSKTNQNKYVNDLIENDVNNWRGKTSVKIYKSPDSLTGDESGKPFSDKTIKTMTEIGKAHFGIAYPRTSSSWDDKEHKPVIKVFNLKKGKK